MPRRHRTLLLLALIGVIAISVYFLSNRGSGHIYNYGGFSSGNPLPSIARSGDHIELIWTPYQDLKATSSTPAMPITMTILLVDEKIANQQLCGFWHPTIVLDELHTTSKDGSSYTRTIEIPQNIQPGTYVLEMEVQKADRSCYSVGKSLTIST